MTKSLSEIQKENRKFILEAIHGCSYEEALKKEEGDFCHYLYQTNYGEQTIIGDVKRYGYNREKHHPDAFLIKIIGKPLTLSRVLLASIKSGKCMDCFEHKNNKYCNSGWHEADSEENLSRIRNFILDNWKNLKLETLEEQTEETQRGINKFFND